MTIDEWVYQATQYQIAHPEQRWGQALFNSLYDHRPDIANSVRATTADPFYDNERITLFLQTVEALW